MEVEHYLDSEWFVILGYFRIQSIMIHFGKERPSVFGPLGFPGRARATVAVCISLAIVAVRRIIRIIGLRLSLYVAITDINIAMNGTWTRIPRERSLVSRCRSGYPPLARGASCTRGCFPNKNLLNLAFAETKLLEGHGCNNYLRGSRCNTVLE